MKFLIAFVSLIAAVSAAPSGYAHEAHVAAVPVVHQKVVGHVSHTPIYNVQKVHHTVHPVSVPVHHPAVTTTHQEPTAVLAQAPKISGYAYTSEVRHDAPVKAIAHAPIAVAHAAPVAAYAPAAVAHAAPVAAYAPAAPVAAYAPAAPALAVGHAGYGHGVAVAHSPAVEVGHAPAPYVSGTSLAVAPSVIKETPAVSSYQLNTGRIDTVSQAHYGTVHTPVVTKVGYQAHAVPVAVSHGPALGHY